MDTPLKTPTRNIGRASSMLRCVKSAEILGFCESYHGIPISILHDVLRDRVDE